MKRFHWTGGHWPHFLRQWREARGLTLDQVAAKIGMTKSSLSRIEAGKTPYYQDILEAYAATLQCSPSDLIGRSPDDPVLRIFDRLQRVRPEKQADAINILDVLTRNGGNR